MFKITITRLGPKGEEGSPVEFSYPEQGSFRGLHMGLVLMGPDGGPIVTDLDTGRPAYQDHFTFGG